MATQQWKTVSARLTEDEENALKILCEKRENSKHAILRALLLKELEPLLKPGHLSEGEGIPLIGEHFFKYSSESDSYIWQIDMGVHGVHVLAENIPFSFLNKLESTLGRVIETREKIENKISKQKTRVPKQIMKYEVKKNVRCGIKN